MILQILARCGAFFIGFIVKGQMNHDFAFGIEVNPCVIEITIGNAKVDIESILSIKGRDFSVKTTVHIYRLFEKFGFDGVFGRSAVMRLLVLKGSGASKLLSNLIQADIIEPVYGHGKGKYKFKKIG